MTDTPAKEADRTSRPRAGLRELKEVVPGKRPYKVYLQRKTEPDARDVPELIVLAEDKDEAREKYCRYCGIVDIGENALVVMAADEKTVEATLAQKHLMRGHPVLD